MSEPTIIFFLLICIVILLITVLYVSTQDLSKTLALNDVEVISLGKKAETLEDYFLKMTGEVEKSC